MSDLRELYQQVILDHNKNPRNFREVQGAAAVDGYNPLCGDRVTVYVNLKDDLIDDVAFKGAGCAISTASASMLTEALRGKSREEALAIFDRFHDMVTRDAPDAGDAELVDDPLLGKLAVFAGVCEFPARVKCATLVWHTLKSALEGGDSVTTE